MIVTVKIVVLFLYFIVFYQALGSPQRRIRLTLIFLSLFVLYDISPASVFTVP